MNKVKKTSALLRVIAKKKIADIDSLANNDTLLELYSNAKTTTAKRRIIDTCALMSKKGYLSVGTVDNQKLYKITDKGLRHLNSTQLLSVVEPSHQRWNGRWYLICFEISESKKTSRNHLILLLKRHGFIRYSKGIWITPFKPSQLVESMKKELNLKNELKMIVASYIDNESRYKRMFSL